MGLNGYTIMAQITVEEFRNFFKYYNGESHQQHAVEILYDELKKKSKDDDALWIQTYRTPYAPVEDDDTPELTNPLDVPYQSQNDNASGTGYRECFSSSCAMVAMYYGKIENDDAYNIHRAKFGDSTDAQAQVRALRALGLEANFITNATTDDLKAQINRGRPTPCGWLHHGNVNAPSGGGHYSVIIGYTKDTWIVHDPNGEASLVTGGYTSNLDGSSQHYSFQNWNPRWIVEGEGSGWMMDISDPSTPGK